MENILNLERNLTQLTGTENYYRHRILNEEILLTDGTKYLADEAGCYWLMDIILSYQHELKEQSFQTWTLNKALDGWDVRCTDGNNNPLITQHIDYSDFPLDEITL